jgi:iron complex outermembrane recepter protein
MKIPMLILATLFGSFFHNRVYAQENNLALEEIITVGTRVSGRSALDSVAPVDVILGDDLINQGDSDLSNLMRTVIPSYNVNSQPISDGATFVRPANLRGLPPDSTLVLVNGKRHHRSAVITFIGGGVSDGSQGADISVFPSISLKQVEVLRDGAAAQYGSDAIAGVINFTIKDAPEGAMLELKYGSFYAGDGDSWNLAGNIGLPFTNTGFVNLSFEYRVADSTSRSVQRDDAAALIQDGNTLVADPAQKWGTPDVDDDFKTVVNLGLDLGGGKDFYAFGNYAQRTVEGGFFFRNPDTRSGIFHSGDSGDSNRLVGDLDTSNALTCPTVAIGDEAALSLVTNNNLVVGAECFVFNEIFPGGFTPSFGGDLNDIAGVAGIRTEFASGLQYDISIGAGRNEIEFFIKNTVNASLGGATPNNFRLGSYIQLEKKFNIDVAYPLPVPGLASSLYVAGGGEWREEQFEIRVGEPDSFEIGPLASQGFSTGANGFPGFSENVAGVFDRQNVALYLDLEAEVVEDVLLGVAVRWENFSDFGSTRNGKLSGRWNISDRFAIRSTASTGFRAPTPGQSNVSNITTVFDEGKVVNRGTISPTNPVALSRGGKALEPEESISLSLGTVFTLGDMNVTLDFFQIEVHDRITQSASQTLSATEQAALEEAGITGASDLSTFRFYTNDFDTTTQGVDLVATYPFAMFGTNNKLSLSLNRTETTVDKFTPDIIDLVRIRQLEEGLPKVRGSIVYSHSQQYYSGLLRINYFDDYYQAHLSSIDQPIDASSEITVDAELSYQFASNYSLALGAVNLFNQYPDKNPWSGISGSKYPYLSPMGFNGGMYYLRLRYEM